MNLNLISSGSPIPSTSDRLWSGELESWRALLAECVEKPTKKRVHALRVATLRFQAQIQYWLHHHGSDHPAAHGARQWNKQARHLRRALGLVRGCDVFLAKLGDVRGVLTTPAGYEPRSSRTSLKHLAILENRLKRDRKSNAKTLASVFEQRQERIDSAISELEAQLSSQVALVPRLAPHTLQRMFADALSTFPKIDRESLHDFRKQIKGVRYLAELMAANHPEITQLATGLKAMQGVIGEWHDWEELAEMTARELRNVSKERDLVELLETFAEESLARALRLCESFITQLVPDRIQPPHKKSVRGVAGAAPGDEALSA